MSKLRTVSLTEDEWARVRNSLLLAKHMYDIKAITVSTVGERQEAKEWSGEYVRLIRAIEGATK